MILRSPNLSALPWLRHGFSTRTGGRTTVYGQPDDLNLGMTKEDARETVDDNRRRFLQLIDPGTPWPLRNTRQIHSTETITLRDPDQELTPADGLLTALPGQFLGVLAADCVPILLADTRQRAVAAIHAGWRGTVAGIVGLAIQRMREEFQSAPEDLLAAIGPSIGPCCYEVGDEVQTRFHDAFPYAAELFRHGRLNLWEANRRQLLAAGLLPQNIHLQKYCTASSFGFDGRRMFFSHRAEDGITGRMMAAIAIAPSDSATIT